MMKFAQTTLAIALSATVLAANAANIPVSTTNHQYGEIAGDVVHPQTSTVYQDFLAAWNAQFNTVAPTFVDPHSVVENTGFSIDLNDIAADFDNVHLHLYETYDPNGANIHTLPGVDVTSHVSPVPIPAAVWLFASGLIGLVGVSRRKV